MNIYACCATTVDNPFNPFDDFEKWYAFDISRGYHTAEWIDRLANTSPKLSNEDNEKEYEEAVDALVALDPKFFKKVTKEIKYELP